MLLYHITNFFISFVLSSSFLLRSFSPLLTLGHAAAAAASGCFGSNRTNARRKTEKGNRKERKRKGQQQQEEAGREVFFYAVKLAPDLMIICFVLLTDLAGQNT